MKMLVMPTDPIVDDDKVFTPLFNALARKKTQHDSIRKLNSFVIAAASEDADTRLKMAEKVCTACTFTGIDTLCLEQQEVSTLLINTLWEEREHGGSI